MRTSIFEFYKGRPTSTFQRNEVVLQEGSTTGKLFVLSDGWAEISTGNNILNKVSDVGVLQSGCELPGLH